MRDYKIKDISGEKFGKLTAISFSHRDKIKRNTFWNCQCDCGNKSVVDTKNLRSGNSKSCGCVGNAKTSQRNKDSRKYQLNEHYLDVIDTSDKAYCLGFFLGDGCVSKNGIFIRILTEDIEILDFIKKSFGSNTIIRSSYNKYGSNVASLSLFHDYFLKFFKTIGIDNRKTYTLQNFDFAYIPDRLMRHMIRGLFDADGCIRIIDKSKNFPYGVFSIAGNPVFLKGCQKHMVEKLRINETKLYICKHTEHAVKLTYGGINNIEQIYHYLYDNSNFSLKRKRDKFEKLLILRDRKINE